MQTITRQELNERLANNDYWPNSPEDSTARGNVLVGKGRQKPRNRDEPRGWQVA